MNLAIHAMIYLGYESGKKLNNDGGNTNKIAAYTAYAMIVSFGIGCVTAQLELNFAQSALAWIATLSILDQLGKALSLIDTEQYTMSNAAVDSIKGMLYKDALDVVDFVRNPK